MKIITYLCCFVVFYALTYAEPIKKNVINRLEVSILPKNYVIPFSAELIGARVYLQKPAKCFRNLIDNQANGTFIIMGETEIICISNKKNDIYDGTLTIYPDGIFSVSATIKDGIFGWDDYCQNKVSAQFGRKFRLYSKFPFDKRRF